MAKKALITGLTGQDGSYLAELLVDKGYQVYGLIRRSSTSNLVRVSHFTNEINIISGDLLDQTSLMDAINQNQMKFITLPLRVMFPYLGRSHH